ncbi:MAG: ABC transporter substrate-binding protein, partial [Planctomycetota bacterium]
MASVLPILGCPASSDSGDGANAQQGPKKIAVQLNWYAEAEHGGIFQGVADGSYKSAGLDVEIRSGGPNAPIVAEVVMGRAMFAIANADDVVLARQQEAPIVALMAVAQNHPRCVLVRDDSPAQSLQDLKGMTFQAQAGRGYLSYMEKLGLLDGVKMVPYGGSVSALSDNPNVAIQGYSYSEPFVAKSANIPTRSLMVSDLGWNPYSSVLVTSESTIKEYPKQVAAFVGATRKAWATYLEDPENANAEILKMNQQGMMTDALQFGAEGLRELALPDGLSADQLGMMTAERWQTLVQQMTDLGLCDEDT